MTNFSKGFATPGAATSEPAMDSNLHGQNERLRVLFNKVEEMNRRLVRKNEQLLYPQVALCEKINGDLPEVLPLISEINQRLTLLDQMIDTLSETIAHTLTI